MIKVLNFKRGMVAHVTKDTPDLKARGALLQEIHPVACKDGLALQKCDARLYALIHVPSGHRIQMRSLRADQAHHWFSTALSVMSWDVPMETIMADHRIKEVLELGKMLEDAFYFPPEREVS